MEEMKVKLKCEFVVSNIADEIGKDVTTVKNWISILEASGIIYLLEPYKNSALNRIIKTPKLYFRDTGLASYLARWLTPETLAAGALNGAFFETYIISEIVKSFTNNNKDPKKHLYYYRDNNQKEIDLLVINEDCIYPVEIKKSANPGKEAVKNFNIVDKLEMKSPNGVVLCLSKEIHLIDDKNYIIPIEYI